MPILLVPGYGHLNSENFPTPLKHPTAWMPERSIEIIRATLLNMIPL